MRRARHHYLIDKAVEAAISAIEIYNKPAFRYREETFSILMLNAWELLLKARILKQNKNRIRSLEVWEKRATKSGALSKRAYPKKNRSGNVMTIGVGAAAELVRSYPTDAMDQYGLSVGAFSGAEAFGTMDRIEEFADERHKSWCIHCGASIADTETSEDHVPSKSLLRVPHPANLPGVIICAACNNGFSADEEYLSLFLHCVLAGSTDPDRHADGKVARALRRHEKLRARIERSKMNRPTADGETQYVWQPETQRVNRVIVKNARGHAFHEYGEPVLTEPDHVWAAPLDTLTVTERRAFENIGGDGIMAGWPEVGSRMMTRVTTGQDLRDGWVIVQDGIYRYGLMQRDLIRVRSVLFEYLATEVCWTDPPTEVACPPNTQKRTSIYRP